MLLQHGSDRSVGDKWCWTIHFDMEHIEPRQWLEQERWDLDMESDEAPTAMRGALDPIMANKWRLSGTEVTLSPKYCLIRLDIFRYAYTVANEVEALRARTFSDEIKVWKKKGRCVPREW